MVQMMAGETRRRSGAVESEDSQDERRYPIKKKKLRRKSKKAVQKESGSLEVFSEESTT